MGNFDYCKTAAGALEGKEVMQPEVPGSRRPRVYAHCADGVHSGEWEWGASDVCSTSLPQQLSSKRHILF